MAPPDFSTARPPSIRLVRPSLVLCTRSPTPATVLVAIRHAAPTTCTPRDNQTRFSERNKGKRKIKQNKTMPDSNSNIAKSMTHHNQTKKRTTLSSGRSGCTRTCGTLRGSPWRGIGALRCLSVPREGELEG
jgi:hypothetical protein